MRGTATHVFFIATCMLMCMVACMNHAVAQQRVEIRQYMFNGLVINPAYAGADEALSLTFVHRKQWAGMDQSPTTQTLSAHTLFRKKLMGLGMTLVNDAIGVNRNTSALGSYAYHIYTGEKSYISFGIQAGIHNRRSDYGSLVANHQNDPKLNTASVSYTVFDFGAGVYYRSERFDLGISAPELIPEQAQVNDSVSIQLSGVNYLALGRYRIALNEGIVFEPGVLIKYLPHVPVSFDLNANFIFRKVLTSGLSYRKKESIDFLVKCQMTPQLQFGYSYDHAIGNISSISNGSHEFMLQYVFRYIQTNVTSPR